MIRISWMQFASFLSGLILTSLIYAAILFLFVFATFSFSGETLSEKEARDAVCFYGTLTIVGITYFIMVKHFKNKNVYGAAGIFLPFLFAIYALTITGIIYFNNLNYFCAFDKARWQQQEWKPFNMAKTLVKRGGLIGRDKQDIITNLGTSDRVFDNGDVDYIFYPTDNCTWEMRLYFKDDKIEKAFLYQEGLSL